MTAFAKIAALISGPYTRTITTLSKTVEIQFEIQRIDLWSRPQQCAEVQPFFPLMERALQEAGMQWASNPSGWPCIRILFANGECRWVLCERHKNVKRKSTSEKLRQAQSIILLLPQDAASKIN